MSFSITKGHSTCSQSYSQPVMPVFNIHIILKIFAIYAVHFQSPNPAIKPGFYSSNKPENHVLPDRKHKVSEIVQGQLHYKPSIRPNFHLRIALHLFCGSTRCADELGLSFGGRTLFRDLTLVDLYSPASPGMWKMACRSYQLSQVARNR